MAGAIDSWSTIITENMHNVCVISINEFMYKSINLMKHIVPLAKGWSSNCNAVCCNGRGVRRGAWKKGGDDLSSVRVTFASMGRRA